MARRNNKEVNEILLHLGEKVEAAAKKALQAGADAVVADAKSRCPVLTGALRDSIHKQVTSKGLKIKIVADATTPDGIAYGKIVEFSPAINKPFLYPALDAARDSIRQNVANAVKEGLKK